MVKYGTVTPGKSAFYFFTANITLTMKLVALNIKGNMLLTEVSHCRKVVTLKLFIDASVGRNTFLIP